MIRRQRLLSILIAAALVSVPAGAAGQPAKKDPGRVAEILTVKLVPPDGRFTDVPRWTVPDRPELVLALSGGGARGVSHAGFLKALRTDGVEFDGIAGTSMGALVGAFTCAGYAPMQIREILQQRNWQAVLGNLDVRRRILSRREEMFRQAALVNIRLRRGRRLRVGAIMESRTLERELYRYLLRAQLDSGGKFDRLRYPFRPVATDILTGRAVIPDSGNLVTVVRGSFAVPGVFRPVPFGDALLVDGGLVQNLPVEAARDLARTIRERRAGAAPTKGGAAWGSAVIAVDVSENVARTPHVRGALDVLRRSMDIVMDDRTRELRAEADLVVIPDVQEFSPAEFTRNLDGLLKAGEDAYTASRDRVWKLLESRSGEDRLRYEGIEVEGTAWITAAELAKRLGGERGEVTRYRVRAELARALNFGPLKEGRVEVVEAAGGRRLRFVFRENPPVRAIHRDAPGLPSPEQLGVEAPVGVPFSLEVLREAIWRAEYSLVQRGSVLVRREGCRWDPDTAVISVKVRDTPVGHVTADVSGEISQRRIVRFFSDLQGKRFRYDRLADRLDEMVERGAIFNWDLLPMRGDEGQVDVRVRVRGDDYFQATAGGAWRGELGWAGFATVAKSNLTGRGDFAEAMLSGSVEGTSIQLRYRTEYGVAFQDLGAEVGARFTRGSFPVVDADQTLPSDSEEGYRRQRYWASLIRRIRWGAVVQGGVLYQKDRLDPTTELPRENRSRTSLFLRLDLDREDRLLFPTRGGAFRYLGERALSNETFWTSEFRLEGAVSAGRSARNTFFGRLGLGLSEGADRRPFWFDPGGHRELYGFIPYGAAAPQYAVAGLAFRREWKDLAFARIYVEAGANAVRTSLDRSTLGDAPTIVGYGASIIANTRYLGPVTLGAGRNDTGVSVVFLTVGFPVFE